MQTPATKDAFLKPKNKKVNGKWRKKSRKKELYYLSKSNRKNNIGARVAITPKDEFLPIIAAALKNLHTNQTLHQKCHRGFENTKTYNPTEFEGTMNSEQMKVCPLKGAMIYENLPGVTVALVIDAKVDFV